jgi:predicted DNA-binding transcriptional regulator AlpA
VNLETLARETPLADLPKLAGALAEAQAIILARLVTEKNGATVAPVSEPEPDRLLNADEASVLCGLTVKQLVRNRTLPFRRKLSGRTIRFSLKGIERWPPTPPRSSACAASRAGRG